MTTEENIPPEFSVEVDLSALSRVGKTLRLAANEGECRKIAKRLGVVSIGDLEGEVRLTASKADIAATGVVRASLVRECIASLEPLSEVVDETFDIKFVRQALPEVADNAEDGEDWDLPELHEGDIFDVGELLVQQLSLAMAAFPRKQGASSLVEQYGQTELDSPFSVLQAVFEKDDKKQ